MAGLAGGAQGFEGVPDLALSPALVASTKARVASYATSMSAACCNRPTFDRLPLNDQIVLRALYDPALTPGMPKDQAMRLVRDIIPRLVEAARQQGERALYQ